jgi:hypothetical protein
MESNVSAEGEGMKLEQSLATNQGGNKAQENVSLTTHGKAAAMIHNNQ